VQPLDTLHATLAISVAAIAKDAARTTTASNEHDSNTVRPRALAIGSELALDFGLGLGSPFLAS
jgi:hypothetical protein